MKHLLMKRAILALLLVLAIVGVSQATFPRRAARRRVVVPAVVVPLVPAYAASYASTGPASPAGLAAVLAELKRISARLDALEKGRPVVAPAPAPTPKAEAPPPNPALAILTRACARCHQKGNETKGGGLILLTDARTIAPLTCEQTLSVLLEVYSGRMPLPKSGLEPLSDDEFGVLMQWADDRKRK